MGLNDITKKSTKSVNALCAFPYVSDDAAQIAVSVLLPALHGNGFCAQAFLVPVKESSIRKIPKFSLSVIHKSGLKPTICFSAGEKSRASTNSFEFIEAF